jgi:hypothetical protein
MKAHELEDLLSLASVWRSRAKNHDGAQGDAYRELALELIEEVRRLEAIDAVKLRRPADDFAPWTTDDGFEAKRVENALTSGEHYWIVKRPDGSQVRNSPDTLFEVRELIAEERAKGSDSP